MKWIGKQQINLRRVVLKTRVGCCALCGWFRPFSSPAFALWPFGSAIKPNGHQLSPNSKPQQSMLTWNQIFTWNQITKHNISRLRSEKWVKRLVQSNWDQIGTKLGSDIGKLCIGHELGSLVQYLSLGEGQHRRQLRLPSDGYISGVMKLFFEFEPLVVAIDDSVFVFSPRFVGYECKCKAIVRPKAMVMRLWYQTNTESTFSPGFDALQALEGIRTTPESDRQTNKRCDSSILWSCDPTIPGNCDVGVYSLQCLSL